MLKPLKSDLRGKGEYGWLKARYTFSFADYRNPEYTSHSDLLVINEDRIAGGKGFDTHSHRNMEIITYMISGAVEHKDSMGNHGVIRPGEIQYMSAGTGVSHSEFNHEADQEAHLLQIWIKPNAVDCEPVYGQTSYLDRLEKNKLCLLASPDGRDDSIKIYQDALFFTCQLERNNKINHLYSENRKGWVQIVKGRLHVNGEELVQGDGLAIDSEQEIVIESLEDSEFLIFDLR